MSTSPAIAVLTDAFGRVHEIVHRVADGLTADQLAWRPTADANSIGWLLWHLARVEDDHLADLAGTEQVWLARGWADRFALPFEVRAIGYGQSSEEVGQVAVSSPELLTGYYDEVHAATVAILDGLSESQFGRVVDTRWDPPVTLAVRVVSVVNDVTQHAGQAAYVKGMLPA